MKHIKGNLLHRPEGINVVIHQTNVHGRMGAGIAKSIKDLWPEVARIDKEFCSKNFANPDKTLGQFSYWKSPKGFYVINLYGQRLDKKSLAGCPTDYNAVICGLNKVVDFLLTERQKNNSFKPVIGVPKLMGCGLGSAVWPIYSCILETIIEEYFPVVCVEFFNQ